MVDMKDIKEIRIVHYEDKYILQARIGYFKTQTFWRTWYDLEHNLSVRAVWLNNGTDTYNTIQEAENRAIYAREYISKKIAQLQKRPKNGKVAKKYDIKTLEKDPDFFI